MTERTFTKNSTDAQDKYFMLFDYHVPAPPTNDLWTCHLRWLVCVMDYDDEAMHFISSVLSHSLKGGITDRQAKAVNRVLTRVLREYQAGILDCQNNSRLETNGDKNLADMIVEGEA